MLFLLWCAYLCCRFCWFVTKHVTYLLGDLCLSASVFAAFVGSLLEDLIIISATGSTHSPFLLHFTLVRCRWHGPPPLTPAEECTIQLWWRGVMESQSRQWKCSGPVSGMLQEPDGCPSGAQQSNVFISHCMLLDLTFFFFFWKCNHRQHFACMWKFFFLIMENHMRCVIQRIKHTAPWALD